MHIVRFFLSFFLLTAIWCSTLTARAATVIPSLTGSFQSEGYQGLAGAFVFLNEDNVSIGGNWFSPTYPLGDLVYYWDTYCSSGPCNVTWSGSMTGMNVSFFLYDLAGGDGFYGVVTSGQYVDTLYYDGFSYSYNEESAAYNFIGTWVNGNGTVGVGRGSGSYYFFNYCDPVCAPSVEWSSSGSIVTTAIPEPSGFVLLCTGVLGIATAIRRRVQV